MRKRKPFSVKNKKRVEFDNLKRDLNNQSAELYHDMSTFKDAYNQNLQDKFSENVSASSYQADMQAAEKAGAAERSADYASQSVNMIEKQRRSLNRIGDKIRNIEMDIRKLSKRLNEIDEPEGRHTRVKEAPEKQ
jgi:hypothetical protein